MTNEDRLKRIYSLTEQYCATTDREYGYYLWGLQDGLRHDVPMPVDAVMIADLVGS